MQPKQQRDITTHLLEWPKPRTLPTANAGEDAEQQKLTFIVAGIQNGTATLEDTLEVYYKTKHILITQSSKSTPWHSPK